MSENKEKDDGAELAAVRNDTGRSETETASDECNACANSRYAADCSCLLTWLERMKEADRITVATVERYGGNPSFREMEVGRAVADHLCRDLKALAGNQPATEVSSTPAASPAQK